jgi:integrase
MKPKNKQLKYKAKGSKKALPITREQFDFITAEFSDRQDYRMVVFCHLLFKAIRGGDVLHTLKIRHIYKTDGTIRDTLQFVEQKTGKQREIPIKGEKLLSALTTYWNEIKGIQPNNGLFFSLKTRQPLSDSGAKKLFKWFVGKRGIEQLSFHSFRKGAARSMWLANSRIESIANVLNHHSPKVTERYICVSQQDVSEAMKVLEI